MGIHLLESISAKGTAAAMTQARLGSTATESGTTFLVWAPHARRCEVHVIEPANRLVPMEPLSDGYFGCFVEDLQAGALYFYNLDGGPDRPDPASRFQPRGVHGPSEVIPSCRPSNSGWRGLPLGQYLIYELHVGTFSAEGTFDGAIPQLDRLRDLGVTAIEIMPVAEFPGGRNWGYDGVHLYAASSAYGGPAALRRLVDACHERGLAAILDVVYNHLGPEGNYLREFGPYFHHRYQTGWGDALNFDGEASDSVRQFFVENALYWINDLEFDALRLDAVHAIYDRSATPFLRELADAVHQFAAKQGRQAFLIAESDLNDNRIVSPAEAGGYGLDAQWADDMHHAVHVALTGQRDGYYADYESTDMIAEALQRGWVYSGQYSQMRRRRFGNSPDAIDAHQLVICAQNHDQVGNRMLGERLEHLVGFEAAKLAAATVLLSPYVPLLFMGEEYAEPAPFLYFVSHSDPELQEAVRKGRRQEFAAFAALAEPPDPQDEQTFISSKLRPELRLGGRHAEMHEWYRRLIELRKTHPALRMMSKKHTRVTCDRDVILMRRWSPEGAEAVVALNFSREPQQVRLNGVTGDWRVLLGSSSRLQGDSPEVDLQPLECALFSRF